ncbi:translation initiation factor IF-2-like [Phyllostomus hastatus]|uniref:translation initiation factor IF-2-like n=1 Tax=Phyllostomus hastatus TaxID=9423 RepID=UPI001E67F631|nr:translation initiation factor IF-2-like [Phyllostomus hastatus]
MQGAAGAGREILGAERERGEGEGGREGGPRSGGQRRGEEKLAPRPPHTLSPSRPAPGSSRPRGAPAPPAGVSARGRNEGVSGRRGTHSTRRSDGPALECTSPREDGRLPQARGRGSESLVAAEARTRAAVRRVLWPPGRPWSHQSPAADTSSVGEDRKGPEARPGPGTAGTGAGAHAGGSGDGSGGPSAGRARYTQRVPSCVCAQNSESGLSPSCTGVRRRRPRGASPDDRTGQHGGAEPRRGEGALGR